MKTMNRSLFSVLVIAASTTFAVASDSGFAGSWKMNLEKSQFAGQTYTMQTNATGGFHYDGQGFAYDFNTNGKEYTLPDDSTVSVRVVDASTWDYTFSMHGKVTGTARSTVQGDTNTFVSRMIKPDGTTVEQTISGARISGGPDFLGKWKSSDLKGAATTMVIETKDKDSVKVTYPEAQEVCDGKFDGQDYVVIQAGSPSKATLAFERTSDTSLKITTKLQGQAFYTDVLTVSDDGKTLTDNGLPAAANEPIKAVFDRQ